MKKVLAIFFVFVVISSCQLAPCLTKDSFVSSSNSTFEKFKKNQDSFSDSKWVTMDSQYENYLEDCYSKYKKEMSSDEIKDFWTQTSRYFIKRSYKGPQMSEKLQELYGKKLENYLEEMGSNFADRFKKLIDINVDDAVDKVFDFLENLGGDDNKRK